MNEREIIRDTLAGYVAGLAGRQIYFPAHGDYRVSDAFVRGYDQGEAHAVMSRIGYAAEQGKGAA